MRESERDMQGEWERERESARERESKGRSREMGEKERARQRTREIGQRCARDREKDGVDTGGEGQGELGLIVLYYVRKRSKKMAGGFLRFVRKKKKDFKHFVKNFKILICTYFYQNIPKKREK